MTEPDTSVGPLDVVESVVQVAVMLASVYVAVRAAVGPDQLRMVQASVLSSAENYCQRQAGSWAHLADACKTAYDKTRLSV